MANTPLVWIALLFLFSVLILPFFATSDDAQTLLSIKRAFNDPQSLVSWSTSDGSSHCSWLGVTCAPSTGSVTALKLAYQDLRGELPATICDLANLTVLDLTYNYISGSFPSVLYRCNQLRSLNLSNNLLVGAIPDDIGRLTALRELNLSGNNFTGDIPSGIGRLASLEMLNLQNNLLNGSVPPEIGDLQNLAMLVLTSNPFRPAEIRPEIGRLKRLSYLYMRQMNLIGPIPESFGNLTALERLDVCQNKLTGSIPAVTLPNLKFLLLYQNQLTGEIPQQILSTGLQEIDLSQNKLTGTLPPAITRLENLTVLYLYINHMSGEIPPAIGQMKRLVDFKLFTNRFNGSLPQDLGRHSNLRYFEVSENEFSGDLPKALCLGGQLQFISAFSNNFSGNFPEGLGRCSSMQHVLAYNNRFSGEIPADLLSSNNLQTLTLGNNSFSGKLPSILSSNLSRLEINNNNLSGEFPSNISAIKTLQVLKASWNSFTGEIPASITELQDVTDLLLDHNQFSGQIPSNIGSLKQLSNLDLSNNKLSGDIPASLTQLPSLNSLDLSDNDLSGAIPADLANLRISKLNLSNNELTGEVPSALDGEAFEGSFLHNPGLCASSLPLTRTLRLCSAPAPRSKAQRFPLAVLIAILAVVGVLALVSIGFAAALLRAYILRRREFGDYSSWKLTSFQRLRFTEEDIRRGLTESHLIGRGGTGKVYRVPIGEKFVAVKRIWNGQKVGRKNERLFQAEVDILGRIRHANVVKLLCSISGDDSRLLVYEFMENGSLDRWLHSSDSVLDWTSRYRVAVGSAQGLCYMHHDCSPPVMHRDVKSSNILLDEDFKPKVADFGLARLIGRSSEPETVSAIAGSLGYIPPEYAYTVKVNEKSDVYSFGVVLLELATGREAHNGGGEINMVDWAWQHFREEKPLEEAMDQRVYDPFVSEQMFAVFKLGLLCTNTLPTDRPPMNEVVEILLRYGPQPDHAKSVDGEKPLGSGGASGLLYHKSLRSQWGGKVIDDSFV